MYKSEVWNGVDNICNDTPEKVFSNNPHFIGKDILITKYGNTIAYISIIDNLKMNYHLPITATNQSVIDAYDKILNGEILQDPESVKKLKESEVKISILEQENADLLLDSAIKDTKIQQNQKDLADLTLEVANLSIGGM